MSTSTEIERAPESVVLFSGAATPDEVIAAATGVADRFSDIVKRQRLYKRIGDRDHILIEAWQTIGSLTGVFAVKDGGVRELPWPEIERLIWVADEPPFPGREPRRESEEWSIWKAADELRKTFEHHQAIERAHALGKAWGFAAAFRAVKDGREVGWGEGRVDRSERTWAGREDYAMSSMGQTRGQSRTLGAPLRFIVKLAGYEPTLPEDDAPAVAGEPTGPVAPWGPVTDDDEALKAAADIVHQIAPEVDGAAFIVDMGTYFDGVPEANLKMLRALLRRLGESRTVEAPVAEAEEVTS